MILEDVGMHTSLEKVMEVLIDNEVEFSINVGTVITITLKLGDESAVTGSDRIFDYSSEVIVDQIKETIIEAIAVIDLKRAEKGE